MDVDREDEGAYLGSDQEEACDEGKEALEKSTDAGLQEELFPDFCLETQSSESSEQALFQVLDHSADNNTVSNISSDREFGAGSEREFDTSSQLEPTAPYFPPSPTMLSAGLSSSSENLCPKIPTKYTVSPEPLAAEDLLDFGDHCDRTQTKPHLRAEDHASDFEKLYTAGERLSEGESADPAGWFLLHDYSLKASEFLLLCLPLLFDGMYDLRACSGKYFHQSHGVQIVYHL